jgi:AcrR family transcriptional regulator
MGRRAVPRAIEVSPKREPDANQEKLLRAAQKLFAVQGLDRTQISQITAEAGTGISMFYRYFTDKNDVLKVLLQGFLDELDAGMHAALQGVERQTPLEQLFTIRKVFEHVIGMLVGRAELTLMLFRTGFSADEGTQRLVRARIAKVAGDIASHIARAEEAGLIVVAQKEVLGHAAAGLALEVSFKLIVEGRPTLEEAVDTCARFVIGGLLAFAPQETFDRIFPAIRFVLQPTLPAEGNL